LYNEFKRECIINNKLIALLIVLLCVFGCSDSSDDVVNDPNNGNGNGNGNGGDPPALTDEEMLDLIQEKAFDYFYSFGHPTSGLARERLKDSETVTIGGSGFGLMAIIVGVERGWITRSEAVDRWTKIVDFLTQADRFHGAWPHWMSGTTGTTIPFSALDNGADLVETSYMAQGLITVRQYLDENDGTEKALIDKINILWEEIEWDWFTKGGENQLYWHWSPTDEWTMDHKVKGWNEALITYVMAASSTTHTITAEVYHNGWAQGGSIKNGDTFYGYVLPLGEDLGGPLFFTHYSFLGLDPRNLEDQYADYWEQNVAHTMINYSYCVDNPKGFTGYSDECWGLTASYSHDGYSAHSPNNDLGVITPTAALSSMPYAPDESMAAMRYFYDELKDDLWGSFGFKDAFNLSENWFSDGYLAIDQGPIVIMIENHRTGKLWDLFMSAPEVQAGLDKLGFSY
jgi:hypothetical protein